MRKINFIICLMAMSVLFAFTSCGNSGLSKKDRQEIMDALEDTREALPIHLLGNAMVMTDLDVQGSQIVCTVEIAPQIFNNLSSREDQLNSDENIESVISSMGNDVIRLLVKKKVGLLYKYVNMADKSECIKLDISAKKLKQIWNR